MLIRRFATPLVFMLMAGGIVFSAAPAYAADSGTVQATVTAASPCILLDTGAIDFGTAPFSTSGNEVVRQGTPNVSISSCGASDEQLLVRGTDAASQDPNSQASWTLVAQSIACDPNQSQPNRYALDVSANNVSAFLSSANVSLVTVPGGQQVVASHQIHMPCSGSSGAGQTMGTQIAYTATF